MGIVAVWGGLGTLLWLALPVLTRELAQVSESIPNALDQVSDWSNAALQALQRRLSAKAPADGPFVDLAPLLPGLATRAMGLVESLADTVSRLSLMIMLSFFFLCERDHLLLRLEWLIPQRFRATLIRAGNALNRELRLYLQGQLMIALLVGMLAVVGLWIAHVRSALVLGMIVGLFNMVPYFGPFIGGAPAVLIALGDGWQKAVLCLGVLVVVQQLDNALLSPRVMGGITGFSPAIVLLALDLGAAMGGIVGMLAALPVLLSIRTIYRVFVQSFENI